MAAQPKDGWVGNKDGETYVMSKGQMVPAEMDGNGRWAPIGTSQAQAKFDDASDTMREVNHSRALIDQGADTGFMGGLTGGSPDSPGIHWGGIPGTSGYDLARALAPIQARLRLSNLARLKANSTNGASGLGSVTEGEGRMLQSTQGSLDTGMKADDLRRTLANVATVTTRDQRGLTPDAPYDLSGGPDNIPRGAYFRGSDGKLYINRAGAAPVGAAPAPTMAPRVNAPAAANGGWGITLRSK